jgi:hypothetical protein
VDTIRFELALTSATVQAAAKRHNQCQPDRQQHGAEIAGQCLVGELDGPGQVGLDIRGGQAHHAEDVGEHLVAEQAAAKER